MRAVAAVALALGLAGRSTRIPIELPHAGLTAYVAAEWVEVVPADTRLAVEPDVPVQPTVADFLAGRDPVLARALALP